jgi:small subunit ribosomal protein S2
MPWVTNRWLGGMLTNWRTIRQRINELDRLERMRDRGEFARITKKEALILERKMERLEMLIGGIREMKTLPELLFVVDVRREDTAIHEANLLEIPVVALVDTNCDPRSIDYVIPSNDDAIRAIKLLVGKIADAVLEGKAMRKEEEVDEEELRAERRMAMEEPQLSDEDLLGEATLAKLSAQSDEEEGEEEEGELEEVEGEEPEEVEADDEEDFEDEEEDEDDEEEDEEEDEDDDDDLDDEDEDDFDDEDEDDFDDDED